MKRILGGQEVEITAGGNFRFVIRNGLFLSAGKMYNFPYNSPGVGINEDIVLTALAEDRLIVLVVEGSMYIINPKEIVEVCNYYNSYKNEKGQRLFVIPVRGLRRLGG